MKKYLIALVLVMNSAVVNAAPNGSTDEASKTAQPQLKEFTKADWTLASLSGIGLGTASMVLGAVAGKKIAGECPNDPDAGSVLGGCFLYGADKILFGSTLGYSLGGPLGIYLYGEKQGFNGSYWATVGGYFGGLLVGSGLAVIVYHVAGGRGDQPPAVLLNTLIILSASQIGGIMGYLASQRPTKQKEESPSASLFHLSPKSGLRLGLPQVSLTRLPQETRVSASLFSGQF